MRSTSCAFIEARRADQLPLFMGVNFIPMNAMPQRQAVMGNDILTCGQDDIRLSPDDILPAAGRYPPPRGRTSCQGMSLRGRGGL